MMIAFFAGVKRWYLRRFRGVVAPPTQYGGQGTTWQQHGRDVKVFACNCGEMLHFTPDTYVIREQEHVEGCEGTKSLAMAIPWTCQCPVTDARYVQICPKCRLGHWKEALCIT